MKVFNPFFWFQCLMVLSSDSSNSNSSSSQDTSGSSVNSSAGIPAHKFLYEKKKVQKGLSKGQTKYIVTLEIGPYSFKRRIDAKIGNRALFSCKLCFECGSGTYASALKTKEVNNKPYYELVQWPNSHDCVPSTTLLQAKSFLSTVKKLIEKNPTNSIAKCYKDARKSFTLKMTKEEKLSFLSEIPSYDTCNSNLYKFRNHFIPKSPATSAEFDTNSDWFKMDDETKENICKVDCKIGNRRIVIMTTK